MNDETKANKPAPEWMGDVAQWRAENKNRQVKPPDPMGQYIEEQRVRKHIPAERGWWILPGVFLGGAIWLALIWSLTWLL